MDVTRSALRLDLTGLRAEYLHTDAPVTPRRALVQLAGVGTFFSLAVAVAWWLEGPRVLVVVAVTLVAGAVVSRVARRPRSRPRTVLRPGELEVRDGGLFGDRFAWWWVGEITCDRDRRVPGRAVLGDGRRLRLRGMPADDVERLAGELDRARAAAAATDDDGEGEGEGDDVARRPPRSPRG